GDLALGGGQRLANLAHDDGGQLVASLAVQLGDPPDERRALGDRLLTPLEVGRVRCRDGLLHLGVGVRRVAGERLAGGGIDDGVMGHFSLRSVSMVCSWGSPSASGVRGTTITGTGSSRSILAAVEPRNSRRRSARRLEPTMAISPGSQSSRCTASSMLS